ncbi:hypothetical protein QVD17_03380 [Tagetes erecta]|uniref:Uncharacterized protein n=1 Tax=Tagetes erecta TaxID=13708 RepID=A0AAD8LE74_TARER|nr:hypothetical protein QVD17_03380 [Tagetes erecta]
MNPGCLLLKYVYVTIIRQNRRFGCKFQCKSALALRFNILTLYFTFFTSRTYFLFQNRNFQFIQHHYHDSLNFQLFSPQFI